MKKTLLAFRFNALCFGVRKRTRFLMRKAAARKKAQSQTETSVTVAGTDGRPSILNKKTALSPAKTAQIYGHSVNLRWAPSINAPAATVAMQHSRMYTELCFSEKSTTTTFK